ncbi:flagellar hook-length control protein FliK [Massilia sp. LXY-6]|uniref:flagellar hook-length control protein FliK n=1 Tax=Massilia sp. LXY-6 TaxID=3379823 RepID=UPI003EE1D823
MTPRIGPGGVYPVGQAEPVANIEAIAHPRQLASQPSLASLLGKSVQGQVLARLDDGSFIVRVNDLAARMSLPAGAQVGSQLPLTLVALAPRPTFQLRTDQGSLVLAEAGLASAKFAHRPDPPAALVRNVALYAGEAGTPLPGAGTGADGALASFSPAGRLLGEVLATAQKNGTPATAALGRTPLLAAPATDGEVVAAALQDGLAKSGLFYESHVAEWAQGARPQAELAAEPQARGMAPPSDPATAQLINLQLNAHEQARVAWQGQLWPGQELRWEIERDAPQGEDGGGNEGDGSDGAQAGWQSSLRLRFGRLGEVAAKLVLSGGQLHIRLDAPEAARALLEAGSGRLADALDAAGTPLSTLAIHAAIGSDGTGQ